MLLEKFRGATRFTDDKSDRGSRNPATVHDDIAARPTRRPFNVSRTFAVGAFSSSPAILFSPFFVLAEEPFRSTQLGETNGISEKIAIFRTVPPSNNKCVSIAKKRISDFSRAVFTRLARRVYGGPTVLLSFYINPFFPPSFFLAQSRKLISNKQIAFFFFHLYFLAACDLLSEKRSRCLSNFFPDFNFMAPKSNALVSADFSGLTEIIYDLHCLRTPY